jgi:2,5-diketo-D-gluconate reductase B
MTETETVKGVEVPALGLGTWRLEGERCREVVEAALELGYRHVDTAQAYGNERQVGAAIEAADVDREDVFLTTKVFGRDARYEDARRSAEESIQRIGVDEVDLLLLHWPNPLVDLEETMRALCELREEGKTRHVGVSNFSRSRLERAREVADCPVFADQVQCHPYRPKRGLASYCVEEDLLLTAYSPLGHGGVVDDESLAAVGESYGKTAAQVALRWATQRENVVAIPKTTSREHLAENLEVFDFELTDAEMALVEQPSLLRTGLAWVRGRLGV